MEWRLKISILIAKICQPFLAPIAMVLARQAMLLVNPQSRPGNGRRYYH
jgi:hypothetical protein